MDLYKCFDCGNKWEARPTWEDQACPRCGECSNVIEVTDNETK